MHTRHGWGDISVVENKTSREAYVLCRGVA
jgi:hypothetical protein